MRTPNEQEVQAAQRYYKTWLQDDFNPSCSNRWKYCHIDGSLSFDGIIAFSLALALREREAERKRCAEEICVYCRSGHPTKNNTSKAETFRYWVHANNQHCLAAPIWDIAAAIEREPV